MEIVANKAQLVESVAHDPAQAQRTRTVGVDVNLHVENTYMQWMDFMIEPDPSEPAAEHPETL